MIINITPLIIVFLLIATSYLFYRLITETYTRKQFVLRFWLLCLSIALILGILNELWLSI